MLNKQYLFVRAYLCVWGAFHACNGQGYQEKAVYTSWVFAAGFKAWIRDVQASSHIRMHKCMYKQPYIQSQRKFLFM